MTCYLLHSYLPALLFTLAVETTVAVLLGFRSRLQILAVNLVSLVTHPTIHCIILTLYYFELLPSPLPRWLIGVLELGVFIVEAALLAYALRLSVWRATVLSLTMNLASYLFGVWVR